MLPWPERTRMLPWSRAAEWQDVIRELDEEVAGEAVHRELPFCGGWVGYLAYECGAASEGAAPRTSLPVEPPLFFALHRAGIAIDPGGRAWLFAPAHEIDLRLRQIVDSAQQHRIDRSVRVMPAQLHDSFGDGAHRDAVEQVRRAIRDGEVYQVNLTRVLSANRATDAAALHAALIGASPPSASAFLRGEQCDVISASPELLLCFDRRDGVADSRPIKGTARRAGDDAREIAMLLASEKDAAEHLMIVDVTRNDFGKVAPAGFVSVAAFRRVQTLEHVHHLESIVRASGLRNQSLADLLGALLPAASITGAPKRAAVSMIREIEPEARGVYCGSIGWIDAAGARFSVAIRAAVRTDSTVRYHAGGGIVWDSEAASEDDESWAKAAAFLAFLEEK